MAHEGVPLVVIQRQLGHANLGITSIYPKASTAARSSAPSTAGHRRRSRPTQGCRSDGKAPGVGSAGVCRPARPNTFGWRIGGLSRSRRGDLSRTSSGTTGRSGHERQRVHAVTGKQGFRPDGRPSEGGRRADLRRSRRAGSGRGSRPYLLCGWGGHRCLPSARCHALRTRAPARPASPVQMNRNGPTGCDPVCQEGRSCTLANATVNARHQTTAVR
jgi:hypothetical protein